MEERPQRRNKPKRKRTEAIYIKVSAEMKQAFYDIADKRELTLTSVMEEMIQEYYDRYVGEGKESGSE